MPSTSESGLDATSNLNCGSGGGSDTYFGLRVASIFIIGIGSTAGALFPVLAKRTKYFQVPKSIFDFAKFFGSGVIIGTAFIHLLAPALEALESECLSPSWGDYPYALAFCLLSIFSIFIVELIAFRWGIARLAKIGVHHDAHGHDVGSHAHSPESNMTDDGSLKKAVEKVVETVVVEKVVEKPGSGNTNTHNLAHSPLAQIVGVAILEFGVALHSVLIGLTLAVDEAFKVLFIVLVFHQTFEGLGLGSRLAYMRLPEKYNFIPILGALAYGLTTPVGIAIGLGVRMTYNPGTVTASIVSGVLDSLSAGILIYTGLVELLAHEFIFNKEMMGSSNGKLAYSVGSMLLGCALMALLGRWA